MNSEIETILNDNSLRGIRLLRRTSLRGLALDMPHQFSRDPIKQRIVRLAGTKYHWERGKEISTLHAVYFLVDEEVMFPRWKDPKDQMNHVRAQINKAALKLYKQCRNAFKKLMASFSDPMEAFNYVVTDFIHESSITYRRFTIPVPPIRQDQLQPKQRKYGRSRYF